MPTQDAAVLRFDSFEINLRSKELRKKRYAAATFGAAVSSLGGTD